MLIDMFAKNYEFKNYFVYRANQRHTRTRNRQNRGGSPILLASPAIPSTDTRIYEIITAAIFRGGREFYYFFLPPGRRRLGSSEHVFHIDRREPTNKRKTVELICRHRLPLITAV